MDTSVFEVVKLQKSKCELCRLVHDNSAYAVAKLSLDPDGMAFD